MAAPKKNQFALSQETIDRLKGNQDLIKQAEDKIASLKKLGMDMREVEDRLTWAKLASETILKDFAP